MVNVYADSEEKYVKNVVLYGKTGDDYVYTDEKCTVKIDKDTLLTLCTKGVIVLYEKAYYVPVSFKDDTSAGATAVTIATVVNAASSASVTLYSEEKAED